MNSSCPAPQILSSPGLVYRIEHATFRDKPLVGFQIVVGDFRDVKQPDVWEGGGVFLQHGIIAGPIKMLGDDFLSLIGVQVVHIRFRGLAGFLAVYILVHYSDVRFRSDADWRVNEFQLSLGLTYFQMRFVFPRQVYVAEAFLHESGAG